MENKKTGSSDTLSFSFEEIQRELEELSEGGFRLKFTPEIDKMITIARTLDPPVSYDLLAEYIKRKGFSRFGKTSIRIRAKKLGLK
jgi:hypothetical protein